MTLSRRSWLATAGALPLALAAGTGAQAGAEPHVPSFTLPAKDEFAPMDVTYLNSGATHPMSLGGAQAVRRYVAAKTLDRTAEPFRVEREGVLRKFARLIHATEREVCYVPSTTTAENLVLMALGLPQSGGRIVTDVLHFHLSFYLYEQMAAGGAEVVTLRLRDGGISLEQFAEAITPGTRLVAISHVSTYNGYEHDVKAICDLAHAQGAKVYVDLAHSAGAVPIDVKAWGVDFAATCAYKWLMGDMGVGFLYVRDGLQSELRRPWFGHRQVSHAETQVFPFEKEGPRLLDATVRDDATGYFEVGFPPGAVLAQLDYSLDWLLRVGVANVQAYRQPLVDTVQRELRARGFVPLTPEGSRTPLVAFAHPEPQRLAPRLNAARVRLTLTGRRFRVSISVFNDFADVERLVRALTV